MGWEWDGIRELLDGKIWEWPDLSFRREWEWDGNGNEVIEMGGNWYEKSVPAHLYCRVPKSVGAENNFCMVHTAPEAACRWLHLTHKL